MLKRMMPDYSESESDGEEVAEGEGEEGEEEEDEEEAGVEEEEVIDDEMVKRFGGRNVEVLWPTREGGARHWTCRICAKRKKLMNVEDCIKHFISREHKATAKRVFRILHPEKFVNGKKIKSPSQIKREEKRRLEIAEKKKAKREEKKKARKEAEKEKLDEEEIKKRKEKFQAKKARRLERKAKQSV